MFKTIIFILVVIVLAGSVVAYGAYQSAQPSSTNIMKGDHNVLILLTNDEQNPGTQVVDMAFSIKLVNGNIGNVTPIYPLGLRSTTLKEPSSYGTGNLLLKDTFWNNDTTQDAADAQKIVLENTKIKTDAVVIIKYPAANAFLNAISPVNIPGYGEVSSNNSEAFLKYMTFDVPTSTLRAGETAVVYHQFKAATNSTKQKALVEAGIQQYLQGNIIIIPQNIIPQIVISKAMNYL
ncbi:DUF4012 domain-containing protein [Methanobacterium sp.]|uniref:DUF4012 domain-containing protein n=1 Tax=Methanobacterium sp. TaxID=2164 RepID=UPI003C75AEB0